MTEFRVVGTGVDRRVAQGETTVILAGIQGPAGQDYGFDWQGNWSAATQYKRDDAVYHAATKVSYICVVDASLNSEPPSGDWAVLVEDGAAAVATHEADPDPHPQYAWWTGLTDAMVAHEGAVDAHDYKRRHGFAREDDGTHSVTLAYNASTRKVTVTPYGANFLVYVDGEPFTKTEEESPAHDDIDGGWFLTYDSAGDLSWSQTPWSVVDLTHIPVAYVYYVSSGPSGVLFFECHGAERNLDLHYNLHHTQGTKRVSGFALSGYTLDTDSDAGVTFGVASGVIADEDIRLSLTTLADAGPYTIFYRSGASGQWVWTSTDVVPFKHGTYPQWNNPNGGGAGVWGLTDLVGTGLGNWVNYYLCAVPSVYAATQLVLIPGQATYGSQAAANGESLSSLALGAVFPFQEIAPLYKLTFKALSTHGGTYKAKLTAVTSITAGGASVLVGTSPSIHNSLSGRDATDAHPASSITNTPAGSVAATDVQAAINELDSEKEAVANKGANSGYCGLDSGGLVAESDLGTGTGSSTKALYGDQTWKSIVRTMRYGGGILKPTAAANPIVARVPVAGTVTKVYATCVGGTSATVNAQVNTSDLRSSDLTVSAAASWTDFSTLQNTSVSAGDYLKIEIVSLSGTPDWVGIQIEVDPT